MNTTKKELERSCNNYINGSIQLLQKCRRFYELVLERNNGRFAKVNRKYFQDEINGLDAILSELSNPHFFPDNDYVQNVIFFEIKKYFTQGKYIPLNFNPKKKLICASL